MHSKFLVISSQNQKFKHIKRMEYNCHIPNMVQKVMFL